MDASIRPVYGPVTAVTGVITVVSEPNIGRDVACYVSEAAHGISSIHFYP
jgi:hypothetical protein